MSRSPVALILLAFLTCSAAGEGPWPDSVLQTLPPKRLAATRPHVLVQFGRQPQIDDFQELTARGATVLEYAPENGLIVSVPEARALDGMNIISARPLAPGEKVSGLVAAASGVRAAEASAPGTYVVSFHHDIQPSDARALVALSGLGVRENLDLLPTDLLVEGAAADVASLAAWDEVANIYAASDELAERRPVHACSGAATVFGPVARMMATVGEGWDGPGLGSARLGYFLGPLASGLPRAAVQEEISRALAEWSRHVDVGFVPVGRPDLPRTLGFLFGSRGHGDPYPFDGRGRVLAHTFYPSPPNPETIAGDLHFDDDEQWGIGSGIDVYSVALHELGHALGLGHSDHPGAVMYPYYARAAELTSEDIAAIRMLYAVRKSDDTPSEPPVPPANPDPPDGPPNNPEQPQPPVKPNPPKPPVQPPSAPDTTAPALTVISPATAALATYDDRIAVRGIAQDASGVAEVTWSDSIGNTAAAQGTALWNTGPLPLRVGTNTITIRARDYSGNVAWRALVITRRRR